MYICIKNPWEKEKHGERDADQRWQRGRAETCSMEQDWGSSAAGWELRLPADDANAKTNANTADWELHLLMLPMLRLMLLLLAGSSAHLQQHPPPRRLCLFLSLTSSIQLNKQHGHTFSRHTPFPGNPNVELGSRTAGTLWTSLCLQWEFMYWSESRWGQG